MTAQLTARPRDNRPLAVADGIGFLACVGLVTLYAKLLLGRWGQPQALDDFAAFWVAGRLAAAGHAAAAYDWVSLNRLLTAGGGPAPGYLRTFFYPPPIFLVVAPLGLLPFATAAALWLGATLAAYLAAMTAIVRRGAALVAALAAPVVLFNFSTGQNGLLTAGLIGGALLLLDVRPVASGILIGLLVYKPHFGLLLPVFLAATGRWRVFASAAATIVVLALLAGMMFGWECFAACARALPAAIDGYLRHDRLTRVVVWSDLESVYGMMRALGAGSAAAWGAHIAVALAAVAASLGLARSGAPEGLQMAALATAMMLLTPYSELNDVAILMVPLAFLVRDGLEGGFRWWEKAALTLVFLMPLLYLPGRALAKAIGVDALAGWAGMGPAMCALLAIVIGHRAMAGEWR
jgi:hypothetical protein